jgi:hypothetical protein
VTAGGRGYHSDPLGVSFHHMVSYLLKKKTLNALSDTNVQKKFLGIFSEFSGSPRSGYFEFWIVDYFFFDLQKFLKPPCNGG